jgi:AraC-like DNA-binding protein
MMYQFTARAVPSDLVSVAVVRSGTVELYDREHTVRRLADGDVFVGTGPQLDYHCRTSDYRCQTLTLHQSLLADIAGRPRDQPAAPWRFTTPTADPKGQRQWQATCDYVTGQLTGADTLPELLLGSMTRLVAATVLTVFPNTLYPGEPYPAARPNAVPDSVRRATAYIDEHAHRDITLADIAEHVRLTPRALQYAFRRHLDTTPLAYLRRVRLQAAHRDLLAADPATATVTQIAARWGFGHQFSALYRAAYQVPPSATLRRTR